jgi:hypothetical protein
LHSLKLNVSARRLSPNADALKGVPKTISRTQTREARGLIFKHLIRRLRQAAFYRDKMLEYRGLDHHGIYTGASKLERAPKIFLLSLFLAKFKLGRASSFRARLGKPHKDGPSDIAPGTFYMR